VFRSQTRGPPLVALEVGHRTREMIAELETVESTNLQGPDSNGGNPNKTKGHELVSLRGTGPGNRAPVVLDRDVADVVARRFITTEATNREALMLLT